jgi:hypothetical protein
MHLLHNKNKSEEESMISLLNKLLNQMQIFFFNLSPVKFLKRKSLNKLVQFIQLRMLELEKLKLSKDQKLMLLN